MGQVQVMWVDDEIDILEAHKIFLEMKGYKVTTFANGYDAVDHLKNNNSDIVLLDESMPGMSGLETLSRIKEIHPHLPIVLVTKNETETLMEEAIGAQIADYLIKPVNPSQVLLCLKKLLDNKRLVAEKTTADYHQQFRSMLDGLDGEPDHRTWAKIYRQLIFWEMEMEKSENGELLEVHQAQKREANASFFKYISRHYASWISSADLDPPIQSHTLFRKKVLPFVNKEIPLIWLVVDNLRYDQWKAIEPVFNEYFRIQDEDDCYSILPTATHYCRNAMFAGEMPMEIEKRFPDKWKKDDDVDGKNLHESFFFTEQLKKLGRSDLSFNYQKISSNADAVKLADAAHNLLDHDLSVVVYNFVDMMSHARTEMDVLKELAADERAYRSLTRSWFSHSPLFQTLKKIAQKKCMVVLCTDHGSIQVKNPVKVTADRQTTSNLRYKNGKNLDYEPREVLVYRDPLMVGLPKASINSSFIFAREQDYFCYPNNFNHYSLMYKNTFQHGGVSMEEMILPVVRMSSRINEK
ncbi:MAG: response regulator [bacterium]